MESPRAQYARRQRERRFVPSQMIGAPANINRHTGEPHQHAREIARRKRQEGR